MPRCQAKIRNGDQCRNNAIPGTNFCYLKSHGASQAALYKRFYNFLRNHLGLSIGIIGLGIAVFSLHLYFQDKRLSSTVGLLKSNTNAQRKYIAVGSSRFIIDSPDNVFLREGDEPLVTLRTENEKLYVSAKIRSKEGELVAELKDNEWQLNKGAIFDRNYNDRCLEVRDRFGKVILQVVNFGKCIHFAGIFHCKNSKTFALIPIGKTGAIMEIRPPGVELEHEIVPICEYPSQHYFGQCPGFDDLKQLIDFSNSGGYRLGGSLEICK